MNEKGPQALKDIRESASGSCSCGGCGRGCTGRGAAHSDGDSDAHSPVAMPAKPPTARPAIADMKIAVLQVLRAIAALAVAQSHVISAAIAGHTSAFQIDFRYLENFGAFGVDLFFAISGFIVPLTALRPSETAPRFLLRRIIRIYPIWWIAVLLTLGIRLTLGTATGPWLRSIPWSLTLLPSLDPAFVPAVYLGWSLIFEMLFYFLIFLCWGKSPATRLWRVLGALLVMGGTGALFAPHFPFSHALTNSMLLQFALGVAMGIWWTKGRPLPRWFSQNHFGQPAFASLALALGLAGLAATAWFGFGEISEMKYILNGTESTHRFLLWGIPSAFVVFGCLVWAPACRSLTGRVLVALGDASYSLYLTSVFTQSVLFKIWRFGTWMPGDLEILLGTALMAAVGYAFYSIVEKPLIEWGRNWMRRTKRPAVREPERLPAQAA